MKILYSWLKDFIDADLPAAELAGKLAALGIETAELKKTGADFEGVFTAKILKIEKHPNADKLSLVDLDTGSGVRKVVCGAKNLEAGIIVPLAREGARLGSNILTAAVIRGIKSDGMICSADELGLADKRAEGILHLDKNLLPGIDVSTLYGKADYIFDLEITPNRPDLLSHLGIARELSVLLNIPLKKIDIKPVKEHGKSVDIKISCPSCQRYSGRAVRGVKNTATPAWITQRLAAMGVNGKNALVDISNYVLYDLGLPLHFFDLKNIDGGINVRFAAEGEKFETLDGSKLELNAQDLVIADNSKAVALAGIMGGKESAVKENTSDIFIEAAYFNPQTINKTAKRYAMSSEASQRFERGADVSITLTALAHASNLVQEICGGEAGPVTDVYPVPYVPAEVIFTPQDIYKILGMEIAEEKLKQIFSGLGKFDGEKTPWKFIAPPHRRDLAHKWDLAEEAARFNGFENIPVSSTRASVAFADNPKNVDCSAKFAAVLTAAGFYECKNFDFISGRDLDNFYFDKKFTVELANPISEEWQFMRPSLLPGMLKNAAFNQSRGAAGYKLFETGKEYANMKGFPAESWAVAGIVCGAAAPEYFTQKSAPADFYFIKGLAAQMLKDFEGVDYSVSKTVPAYMHPKICMDILDGGRPAGFFGKLHPLTAKAYGLKNDEIYIFTLNLKTFEKKFKAQEFKPARDVPQFPSSYRDLSFVFDKNLNYAEIDKAVNSAGAWSKMSYNLTDVYTGPNLPEGKKSVTLNFSFWLMDRTLKDAEVDDNISKISAALSALGGELRK
ncbi:MAG: phenylalanine--tRNA ligase subunit beta [Elusimicrobium sp.]|jgi:phenylalanyl-tRNA synthetase beta chain|nr:phenylalanine--tRNA ligase subunit beta [Elusimicrobium sp.]